MRSNMQSMKGQQSGFTLVEIAIVLVIIGLLLGGILKGQELINSAKTKSFAQDFRNIQTALYGYQDRFKAVPGDHATAGTVITGATNAAGGTLGNSVIEGNWNTTTGTEEAALFWQHVRLAGFMAGPTAVADPDYYPKNADGGRIGINSATPAQVQIATMAGTYQICSNGILGRFAKQLDIQMDDGNTNTGSVRVTAGSPAGPGTPGIATNLVDDATSYAVCMTF